ncbi:MAG: hypothetical protein KGK07_05140 [Chloroflexota bacterium]|nr:hypothetical protein [Chloroflexota bacterium]
MSRSRRHEPQLSSGRTLQISVRRLRTWLLPAAAAAAIVLAGIWAAGLGRSGDSSTALPGARSTASTGALPAFVSEAAPRVQAAYAYAAAHQAELASIPCYCGCGGHSGHRSVHDCFIKPAAGAGIIYEQHGSTCDVCVGIVLDARTMLAEGKSLVSVRQAIDAAYSSIGPGTDTPLPPGMVN